MTRRRFERIGDVIPGALQAIETSYRGYRFRSRLEARYAVFFDALGVRWGYEVEGFRLSDGDHYLPDFWLPDQKVWIEVKGAEPTERETRVAIELASATRYPVAVVGGNWNEWARSPDFSLAVGWWFPLVRRAYDDRASFYDCGRCQTFYVASLHDDNWHCPECGTYVSPLLDGRIEEALNAARAARFEHGESPTFTAPITRDASLCSKCQASFPTQRDHLCDACRADVTGDLEDWKPDPVPESTSAPNV